MKAQDIYAAVASELIASIEQGLANPDGWSKPWASTGVSWNQCNAKTGKTYQGFNWLALNVINQDRGYTSNRWGTFVQWKEAGKKLVDAKGAGVHLIKWTPAGDKCRDHGGESCSCGFATGFCVFNESLIEGYEAPAPVVFEPWERVAKADELMSGALSDGLKIVHRVGDRAYYERSYDQVTMPETSQFEDAEGYYATLLHEMAHASGHESRVNREHLAKKFGDQHYAMEELVAEFASAMMSEYTQIDDTKRTNQHLHYLANWVSVLKNDPKALVSAASAAQKAADYWTQHANVKSEVCAA